MAHELSHTLLAVGCLRLAVLLGDLPAHGCHHIGQRTGGQLGRLDADGDGLPGHFISDEKLAAAVSRAASNINQICRRINSTGRCYENDVAELKARQAEIWELLKTRQKDEL